jgi:adenylate cyclase
MTASPLAPRPAVTIDGAAEDHVREQYERALQAEERAGRRLSTAALLGGLLVIAMWLLVQVGASRVLYYQVILGLFALLTIGNYVLASSRYDPPWRPYAFVSLGLGLLAYTIVVPNPFVENWPTQTRLRFGNFVYVLLFLGPIALSYRPMLMIWAGLCAAVAWAAATGWVLQLPDTITWLDPPAPGAALGAADLLRVYLDPRFVDLEAQAQNVIVALLLAGVLALVMWRSRRLVLRQLTIARERANLARYFPPSVVNELAQLDRPLRTTRQQPVAVMFADIVGFTQLAERAAPDQVVALLRAFHQRVERAIFDHGGTLDKFLGDGVMATFGTPDTGPRDAVNALACAFAMAEAIDRWNVERAQQGEPPIRLSIGIHYGPVLLGDIGSARRLEFAVLGDVVNVAQRLEGLTRELSGQVVVSDELVRALKDQVGSDAESFLAGFRADPPQHLRGRAQPVPVWTLPRRSAAASPPIRAAR